MCRREGGSRCYARAWMGWFLGGCGREGNGLGSASRRGGELRGTRRRHDREDTGEEVFEGARDHCAADITASPKITNILERRSPLVLS